MPKIVETVNAQLQNVIYGKSGQDASRQNLHTNQKMPQNVICNNQEENEEGATGKHETSRHPTWNRRNMPAQQEHTTRTHGSRQYTAPHNAAQKNLLYDVDNMKNTHGNGRIDDNNNDEGVKILNECGKAPHEYAVIRFVREIGKGASVNYIVQSTALPPHTKLFKCLIASLNISFLPLGAGYFEKGRNEDPQDEKTKTSDEKTFLTKA